MDNVKENRAISVVKKIFLLFVLAACTFFVIGQIKLSHEKRDREFKHSTFSEGWIWLKEDGTKEAIEIPGKCEAERNEFMVIENTLPEDVEDNLYLFIRSSKQEMKVYIDGSLREEYSTKDTRWFGKVSAVAWVFIELHGEDAGKNIRIELQTDTSYSGVFHDIHYGRKWDIYRAFFREHGMELIVGLSMFFLGVVSIAISIALKITYKKYIEMEYLAWEVFLISIWIISNSVFRQVLFPSISIVSDMAFFMVMLIAISVMLYLNGIQKERYWKAYFIAVVLNLIDAVVCTVLHIFNIIDFSDSIKIMGVVAGLSIALMVFTLIRDLIIGKIKEYKLVALGICAICIAGVVQLIIYFSWTNQFNGSVMAAGLVIVLAISFINTINDVLSIEKEKQKVIVSNEAKGKFLANMSHEIRTPINSVLGMNTMILRECEDESIREYAMNIQNAGQTLLALINDILDFSKIESGKMEIIPVDYDFSSIIHDVVTMIMMRAEDKGLKMNLSVDKNIPCRLYGDEVRIRQILINLLTNAVKYTKNGSMGLKVSGKRDGEDYILRFEVEDTGIGIKPEDIEKLFTRFERIEEERNRNIEGTGLGMSITMQLLKLMDSELEVESEYGKGSKFAFELKQKIMNSEPVGDLEGNIKRFPTEYKYIVSYVAPDAKVLVVDDNMMNRKVFIGLMKRSKIQIDEAESGPQCLEKAKEKHYDIIFLDHMMPNMDGIETLKHMKEMEGSEEFKCKNTPVIALTANAIQGAKEMYLDSGFDDFLSKPVQPEKLEKMIAKWLPEDLIKAEDMEEEKPNVNPNLKENELNKTDEVDIDNNKGVKYADKSELPEIEGISWESATERIPDMDVLLETVNNFYSTMSGEADFLEDCYNSLENEEGNVRKYRIKVHSMKSTAALIGADSLSESAKELEKAAKEGNLAFIKDNTIEFLEEWRSYKKRLSVLMNDEEKADIEDNSVILEILEKLKGAMDDMDIDESDELMKSLLKYNYSEKITEKMNVLSSAVVDLDSDLAAKIIDEISIEL